jgi:hypothetical protein
VKVVKPKSIQSTPLFSKILHFNANILSSSSMQTIGHFINADYWPLHQCKILSTLSMQTIVHFINADYEREGKRDTKWNQNALRTA